MNISVPLTPHLEQFLHEQLATGRFQTEDDIIFAALRLLEDQSHVSAPSQAGSEANAGQPKAASWEELRAGLHDPAPHHATQSTLSRRSPRGILADLRSNVSLEDFLEARRDMWACLPRRSA